MPQGPPDRHRRRTRTPAPQEARRRPWPRGPRDLPRSRGQGRRSSRRVFRGGYLLPAVQARGVRDRLCRGHGSRPSRDSRKSRGHTGGRRTRANRATRPALGPGSSRVDPDKAAHTPRGTEASWRSRNTCCETVWAGDDRPPLRGPNRAPSSKVPRGRPAVIHQACGPRSAQFAAFISIRAAREAERWSRTKGPAATRVTAPGVAGSMGKLGRTWAARVPGPVPATPDLADPRTTWRTCPRPQGHPT